MNTRQPGTTGWLWWTRTRRQRRPLLAPWFSFSLPVLLWISSVYFLCARPHIEGLRHSGVGTKTISVPKCGHFIGISLNGEHGFHLEWLQVEGNWGGSAMKRVCGSRGLNGSCNGLTLNCWNQMIKRPDYKIWWWQLLHIVSSVVRRVDVGLVCLSGDQRVWPSEIDSSRNWAEVLPNEWRVR